MKPKNFSLLLLTAVIWGMAFVAQRVGMDHVGPFTFNGLRYYLGFLVLLPVLISAWKKEGKLSETPRDLFLGGLCCGTALCVASSLQQIGIRYTSVGKAGFLTACYIVIVPLLGLFFHKKVGPLLAAAVLLALIGLYLLCVKEGFSIQKGDVCCLLCSLGFSVHILVIDYFSPRANGVALSCLQFLVAGLLCTPLSLALESPSLAAVQQAALPLAYAGVFSCGVGYTLQIIGQKGVNPTLASLILSLESCISVLAGWLLLGQRLSGRELLGCVIMFVAIVFAQLPQKGE
ncbi:MAG: DMT family transporter [Blautia sp.]|nr:DMT family transporter [Blautia sp.]